MILVIVQVLLAYLLGSIPSAVWVGKLFYGIDVRQHLFPIKQYRLNFRYQQKEPPERWRLFR